MYLCPQLPCMALLLRFHATCSDDTSSLLCGLARSWVIGNWAEFILLSRQLPDSIYSPRSYVFTQCHTKFSAQVRSVFFHPFPSFSFPSPSISILIPRSSLWFHHFPHEELFCFVQIKILHWFQRNMENTQVFLSVSWFKFLGENDHTQLTVQISLCERMLASLGLWFTCLFQIPSIVGLEGRGESLYISGECPVSTFGSYLVEILNVGLSLRLNCGLWPLTQNLCSLSFCAFA